MLTKDVLFGVNILSLAGLLLYALIAISAHFLMSLGQTLFHLYLGHRRFGGRFFRNHMQFHHVHYSGNHVVSAHYLDNGRLLFPEIGLFHGPASGDVAVILRACLY